MNKNSSAARRRAPGWVAPVLAVVLVLALVWTLGVTLFRGVLENRGLPEEIRGASDAQFMQWEYGAQLANLAVRATALEGVAPKTQRESLGALRESLEQGAALLGQVRYEDDQAVSTVGQYSPEAAALLIDDVVALGVRAPIDEAEDAGTAGLLTRVAFEVSVDARGVLADVNSEAKLDELPVPFTEVDPEENQADASLEKTAAACLTDPNLLRSGSTLPEDADAAAVSTARALDRGYALDYVLQLQAARGAKEAAQSVEEARKSLANQLKTLRTAVQGGCADLRQAAYNLPDGGLEELSELASGLENEFLDELLAATASTEGEARRILAATTWQALAGQQDEGKEPQLLTSAS